MEHVYVDGAYTVPHNPPAAFKSANNNDQLKSRSLLAVITLLVICLVLSVAALALTLGLWNRSRIALEEHNVTLTKTQQAVQSLSDEVSAFHQVETALALTLGLWNRSRMALEEKNVTLTKTQQALQSLSDEISAFHQVETEMSCLSGYIHNPYANSCLRLVYVARSWSAARLNCQSRGETLATFETLESQYWFINLRKTSWQTASVWVGGGKLSSGGWMWDGKTRNPMTIVVWASNEPNNQDGIDEDCLSSRATQDYKFNDAPCDTRNYYICEMVN